MKPSKLQKKATKFALPAALVAGGLAAGSLFSPIGFASAQDGEADSETPTTTEQPDTLSSDTQSPDAPSSDKQSSEKPHGAKRGGHPGSAVAEALGLTQDEIQDGIAEDKTLGEIAEKNGVAVSDLKAAIADEMNERIEAAVSDGRIDAEKAAESKAGVNEAVDKIVETKPSDREGRAGKGHGRMGRRDGHRVEQLGSLSEVLGLSSDEIREGLSAGKTMADLATEQGVSEDELVAALLEGVQERVEEAIESGKADADKAAETTENAEERIREFVNGERSERTEGSERSERTEGSERSERTERSERPERNGERSGRDGGRGMKSEQVDTSSDESGDV